MSEHDLAPWPVNDTDALPPSADGDENDRLAIVMPVPETSLPSMSWDFISPTKVPESPFISTRRLEIRRFSTPSWPVNCTHPGKLSVPLPESSKLPEPAPHVNAPPDRAAPPPTDTLPLAMPPST